MVMHHLRQVLPPKPMLFMGGRFEHGLLSGFFASFAGSLIGSVNKNAPIELYAILGAVVGGTAEVLGGGKFANGAVTGAFVGMFNHGLHQDKAEEKTGLLEWGKTSEKKKIEVLLNAARENGYTINLDDYFYNIRFEPENGLGTSFNYSGIKTKKPVLVNLGGVEYKIYFALGIPINAVGNINSPIVNLGIRYTVSYNYDLKYGAGQPFPGSSSFFRIVIYGSENMANRFYNWYLKENNN